VGCNRYGREEGTANLAFQFTLPSVPCHEMLAAANPWLEPSVVISVVSVSIGFAGFLFGILSYRWNRRESRLDAVTGCLDPLIRAAQELHMANNCRRTSENLKASFPNWKDAPEAAARISEMYRKYGEHISESQKRFRDAGAELAARSFRFPDTVVGLLMKAQNSLSEFGRLVNDGLYDKANLQFETFRKDYAKVTRTARGWRLADPIEGLRRRFSRKNAPMEPDSDFALTKAEMDGIMELITKRGTSQAHNAFAVHPPKKLLEKPDIVKADDVVDQLKDSIFVVRFQDGTSKMLGLVELMVFIYNLILLKDQHDKVARMMSVSEAEPGTTVKVSLKFSERDIMRPEMVKALLSKITWADSASDG